MSHEIRTPLSSIVGFVDLLQKGDLSDKARNEYLQIVQKNAHHMKTLINEILDFSKIESGKLEIKKMSFPLAKELDEVRALFDKKNPKIQFSVATDSPLPEIVYSDPMRLRQILVNVIGNAFKFTESGKITLRVRLAKSEQADAADKLVFQVEDSGKGITESERLKIFDPFHQAEARYNSEPGTGLGLSLSRTLASLLGGDVRLVRSQVGSGSVFEVTIDPGDLQRTRLLHQVSPAVRTDAAVRTRVSQR